MVNKNNLINFIRKTRVKKKNVSKLVMSEAMAYWIMVLIICIIPVWTSVTLYEKIILCVGEWIYAFIAFLYGAFDEGEDIMSRNRFLGWSLYIMSFMLLYTILRFQSDGFNWVLLVVLIVDYILQSISSILGLRRNIKLDRYNDDVSKEIKGTNYYVVIQIVAHIVSLCLIIILRVQDGSNEPIHFALICACYLLYSVFLQLGLTSIYQNYIIKKYNLYYMLK